MLSLNEVCGRQIGSWIADRLLLKIQKVDLELLFRIFSKQPTKRKSVDSYSNLIAVLIGVTLAAFHMSGKMPTFSDSLKIILRGSQITSAASFSIFAGILSGPGDLELHFGRVKSRKFAASCGKTGNK